MAHSISRGVLAPPIPLMLGDGGGDAAPLSSDDSSGTEWDSVMTRDQRWVTCRSGITDLDDLARELDWFRMGIPSGSVTFYVLERVVELRERIVARQTCPRRPPMRSR